MSLSFVATAGLLAVASPVESAPASAIVVRVHGEWDDDFETEVERELAAQLERDDLELVRDESMPHARALATIDLRSSSTKEIVIEVAVRDEVTQKSLMRRVDLSSTPADARALELAISAAELIHASWAELALTPRPPRPAPPPAPVEATLERRGVELQPSSPSVAHGLRVSACTRGSAGLYTVGGTLDYAIWPWPKLGFVIGAGGSGVVPIDAPHGRILGAELRGVVGVLGTPWLGDRFALDIEVAVHPGVLWSWADANDGFEDRAATNFIIDATLGVRPRVRVGGVWLLALVDAGGVFGGVRIRDEGQTVARYSGFVWSAGLGVAIPLTGDARG